MNTDHSERQLARLIYHRALSIMKFTLDLEEQKYLEKGRKDERYKFFKKQLMAQTYENLRLLFKDLESLELIRKVSEYEEDVKDGYRPTSSGGSGYLNADRFEAWLQSGSE